MWKWYIFSINDKRKGNGPRKKLWKVPSRGKRKINRQMYIDQKKNNFLLRIALIILLYLSSRCNCFHFIPSISLISCQTACQCKSISVGRRVFWIRSSTVCFRATADIEGRVNVETCKSSVSTATSSSILEGQIIASFTRQVGNYLFHWIT